MSNIKIIRFANGDEILASITSELNQSTLTFVNPVRILVVPPQRPNDKAQVALAPWTQFSKDKAFTVDQNHVLVTMDPLDEFVNEYRKITGSIIINTNPGLVLPT